MKVVVLVGKPGSGKSTFAKKYSSYQIINQDTLGDRYKCLELFRQYLSEGKNVIVDRCNINKSQRALWINEAKQYNVKEISCIYLSVDPDTCVARISKRKNHPTIKEDTSIDKMKEIVYNFNKSFEAPSLEEGFDKVLFMRNG